MHQHVIMMIDYLSMKVFLLTFSLSVQEMEASMKMNSVQCAITTEFHDKNHRQLFRNFQRQVAAVPLNRRNTFQVLPRKHIHLLPPNLTWREKESVKKKKYKSEMVSIRKRFSSDGIRRCDDIFWVKLFSSLLFLHPRSLSLFERASRTVKSVRVCQCVPQISTSEVSLPHKTLSSTLERNK